MGWYVCVSCGAYIQALWVHESGADACPACEEPIIFTTIVSLNPRTLQRRICKDFSWDPRFGGVWTNDPRAFARVR